MSGGTLSAGCDLTLCDASDTVAVFTQTGGTVTIACDLYVAYYDDCTGTYHLSGGSLEADNETISDDDNGVGTLNQTGGTNTVREDLVLGGYSSSSDGTYDLVDGTLSVGGDEVVGDDGRGRFLQSGGTHTVAGCLYVAYEPGSAGEFHLSGGSLEAGNVILSCDAGAAALFQQTGGTHTVLGDLALGSFSPGSDGTYELADGELAVQGSEVVGDIGAGTFTQSGGTHSVGGALVIGTGTTAVGTLSLSGGSLAAHDLRVGGFGAGTLEITDSNAEIRVSNSLTFGPAGTCTAAPGSAIHMTGAAVENQSATPADLAGLANLALIFEGGPAVIDDFEAAGQDLGAAPAGWVDNFALGTLQLGGLAAGRLRLVDGFDNQPGWAGAEALYVGELILNAGAAIDLNGLHLYYLNGGGPRQLFHGDATLDGRVNYLDVGIVATNYGSGGLPGGAVPEPASAALIVAAAALSGLLGPKRR